MKKTNLFAMLLVALAAGIFSEHAWCDTFGNGANTFDIAFVNIDKPGNAADTTAFGSVANTFRMGKFEISEQMIDKANTLGILGITKTTRAPDKPATQVSWSEAARFINWLNTITNSTPAYKFAIQPGEIGYDANANIQLWAPGDAGYDPNNLYRNSQAQYFLPSADEWYKAAYYDPTSGVYHVYPTGDNVTPVASGTAAGTAVYGLPSYELGPADITLAGGLSPYRTMGQGGNVREWEETSYDRLNDSGTSARGKRGGNWVDFSGDLTKYDRFSESPTEEYEGYLGFRVASTALPEPSTLLLGVLTSAGLLLRRRR